MNTMWFILVVLMIVTFQGHLYSKYASRRLSVDRCFSVESTAPGEALTLNISVTNRSLIPLTWIHIGEAVPAELKFRKDKVERRHNNVEYTHNIVMSLLPFQRVNRKYSVEFTKRGYYELKNLEIGIADMLGDNSNSFTIQVPAAIVVYPRYADISGLLMPVSSMQGDVSVKRWIIDDPTMLIGQREYIRGDSLRNINWKRSARERKLMVNKNDYTSDKSYMLLLDLDELGDIWSTATGPIVERTIEICAFVADSLIAQGIPTGFATNALYGGRCENGIVEPGTGSHQLEVVLDCLGRIQYYKKNKFMDILVKAEEESGWGSEFIVIVPSINEGLLSELSGVHSNITLVTATARNLDYIPENISIFAYMEEGDANAAG